MTEHTIEPTMKRVAALSWPGMTGCYLIVSGKQRNLPRQGDRWYSGHQEHKESGYFQEFRTEAAITFTYVEDGVAAEWDGEQGPIQLWFRSTEGFKEGHDEAREHWLWPWAYGAGHWAQSAVDEANLPRAFNDGDYARIFGELRLWVRRQIRAGETE
jgi:hypothetical protein